MLLELSQNDSVSGALAVASVVMLTVTLAVLMKLLGAIRTFEFVAFTRGREESDCGKQQGKAFHWRGI